MKRSDFLKILGLSAVSGAVIAQSTFGKEIKPNTVGYFINQLPIEHQNYLSKYEEYFNNYCMSGYYALMMLTEKFRINNDYSYLDREEYIYLGYLTRYFEYKTHNINPNLLPEIPKN